ncbi:unnamed protein product [Nippostrongylus brasiliensis]|uniref:Probable G-protein coupled receptor (inferred by orthology to a C. elegans protein) n=1 Tax=Nippostrongylus brasiliensis TaxID=27835 RepID=A0A0N4YEP5_NIPBR|nr:unnamed protein product [Nippostrongylus brasiliensis]
MEEELGERYTLRAVRSATPRPLRRKELVRATMDESFASNMSSNMAPEEDEFLMPSMIDMSTTVELGDNEMMGKKSQFRARESKYTSVQDVLPPPNNEDLHVVVMAVSYLLLFLLGTCGNVAVLTTIYHVVRSSRAALDNTLIYVIVLSCVDFGVCLSLPFTVIDQILGFWMFGTVPCKLHAVFENFGKILSALILTAMSFDRYAGVCHPQKKFLRSRKLAISILIGLAAYALITLCPLLWSFTSREIIMFARETGYRKITRMKIEKCTVDIDSQMFTAFTIYQFVLCYCTPLVLIAYFYSKLLRKLREHARTFKSSHIPLMRISLYTLAVACFYFLCWTPFWMATVFAVYLENTVLNIMKHLNIQCEKKIKTFGIVLLMLCAFDDTAKSENGPEANFILERPFDTSRTVRFNTGSVHKCEVSGQILRQSFGVYSWSITVCILHDADLLYPVSMYDLYGRMGPKSTM